MASESPVQTRLRRIALVGNPNVGKSTLFGRLAGARVHTSNFPGTTQEAHLTTVRGVELIDLPGVYSLRGEESEAVVCRAALAGRVPGAGGDRGPDAIALVLDAANLERNLRLAAEVIQLGLPLVIVLNRVDQAASRGMRIDTQALAREAGCEVLETNGLTGQGVDAVLPALSRARVPDLPASEEPARDWAARVAVAAARPGAAPHAEGLTDRLDSLFTHPVAGTAVFAAVMTLLFWAVFKLATYPMDLIDAGFAWLGGAVAGALPEGAVSSLLVDGVIGGVGATVVFLPQICLMFFLITLLEQSGYLPRAALLVDRVFKPFGLPGQAFVPMLSAHACAIPGIIACRGIPDRRERIATILVAPFLSCSARIPVYVLLTSLLFADRPGLAALAFTGCYLLGAVAALATASVLRRTLLRSPPRPMALELPSYRRPSLRHAAAVMWDRGVLFLRKAGTVILGMMVALWWLGEYPHVDPPPEAAAIRERAATAPEGEATEGLLAEAARIEDRHATANSFMGMAGRAIAPVFAPLGYDWQLTIGIVSSFAAREVFVSTMAVVLAAGEDELEGESGLGRIGSATRDDGVTPVFTRPVVWSLLVFYVLAMQCLPTLAVTAREAGGWRWAGLQFGYMTLLAYLGGLAASLLAGWLG